ncbi:hypothetical protein R1sor_005134 [Riccia sorocarpa]|uniref:Uncharacterized protein n=1 Tax=Riccia sorocarpa TaxID=122646 RepID=A0ABD3HJA7_9MARC
MDLKSTEWSAFSPFLPRRSDEFYSVPARIQNAPGSVRTGWLRRAERHSTNPILSGTRLRKREEVEVGSRRVNSVKRVKEEWDCGGEIAGTGEQRTVVSTDEEDEEDEKGGYLEEAKGAPLIGSMADLLNLEKQFAFYGAYHSNKFNILIHMFFVWPIFFTNGILWAYTPAIIPVPLPAGTLPFQQYMVLNVNFLIFSFYALYYVAFDRKAGSLGAALCLALWIASQALAQAWPWSTAWKFVLLAQITCWTGQVLGHVVFEGRAPALTDNFAQAMLMAPFFVLFEFLQAFFGYEPYPGFNKNVGKKIEENIAAWKARKAKKAA